MELLHFTILAILGLSVVTADDWGYWGENGPENWKGVCKTGTRQSPIDIVTEDTIKTDLGALKFVRYDFAFAGNLTNNGHSVEVRFDGVPILLEGGGLPNAFVFEQMHFHWDAEHTIDGVRHPLELHFVHYDKQYPNISEAAKHENGLAVVATLFELSRKDNLDLMPIIKATQSVSKWVGKSTAIMRNKIIPYLYLPKDHTTYYRYDGSLTTPGCQESVMWFVLTEKLTVSQRQLNVFRNVMSENGKLKYNYRPVQPLNERKVFHHLDGYSKGNSIAPNLAYTFLSSLLVRTMNGE